MVGKHDCFSNGDFIVPVKRENMVLIYRGGLRFGFHYCLRLNGDLVTPDFPLNNVDVEEVEFRYASPHEVKAMLEALLSKGVIWDFVLTRAVCLDDFVTLFNRK